MKSRNKEVKQRVLMLGLWIASLVSLLLERSFFPGSWFLALVTFFCLLFLVTSGTYFYKTKSMTCPNCHEEWVYYEEKKLVRKSYKKALLAFLILQKQNLILKYSCDNCDYKAQKKTINYRILTKEQAD